jgi:hypothetical protein
MKHGWTISLLAAVALAAAPPATAAGKKPPAKIAKKAPAKKPVIKAPVVAVMPSVPGGFMVPKAVVLRNPSSAEAAANAVWNVRAGLNVAALQCQFSGYLKTVKNYNDFLKHHGDELVAAQQTMISHFRRYDGARAASSFDQYTTRTYNSYSTLDAQYAFCDAAGRVGRLVLALPKGKLTGMALTLLPQVRQSLMQQALSPALAIIPMAALPLPEIEIPA